MKLCFQKFHDKVITFGCSLKYLNIQNQSCLFIMYIGNTTLNFSNYFELVIYLIVVQNFRFCCAELQYLAITHHYWQFEVSDCLALSCGTLLTTPPTKCHNSTQHSLSPQTTLLAVVLNSKVPQLRTTKYELLIVITANHSQTIA